MAEWSLWQCRPFFVASLPAAPHSGLSICPSRPQGDPVPCRTYVRHRTKAAYHVCRMSATLSAVSTRPQANRLLAALPDASLRELLPFLEAVRLPLGMVVYESGGEQRYVYFPTSSIVSLLYVLADGSSAEIAVTGNEGLVGISLFMGGETTPSRAVVQSAGHGFRLKGEVLRKEFESGGVFQQDRKSTRLNYSHGYISYAVFCLKKKNIQQQIRSHE